MAEVVSPEELVEEPSDYGHLRAGTKLGRYELLVPVARGGMARVWAARQHGQRGFQKLVAIKTILPELAREREFETMFLDEARIASGIHHPNVCEIYELGEEQRVLYMAMEWVNGDSLARLLRPVGPTERLDVRIASRIVADACAGAHAAHELEGDDGQKLGVVHRDLSPHNVLLTLDGVGKVCDFGVAKALGQLHDATSAGQLKGKIAYMAPEQITGGAVDRRSDVFSLGVLLYEASTGARPFKGDADHQVMHSVLKGEFVPPSTVAPGYPVELERIVQRALASDPAKRFPTAERMWLALEEMLAGGPLVTQADVGRVLRGRLAAAIDRRKERIRAAQPPGEGPPSSQPRTPDPQHRSGVKDARPASSVDLAARAPLKVSRPSVAPPLPSGRPSAPPPPLPSGRPPAMSVKPGPVAPSPTSKGAPATDPPASMKTEPSAGPERAAAAVPTAKPPAVSSAKPAPAAPPRASVAPPRPASIAPPRPTRPGTTPPPPVGAPAPSSKAPSVARVPVSTSATPRVAASERGIAVVPVIPPPAALPRLDDPSEADDPLEATAVMYPSATPQPPPVYTPAPYSGHFRAGPPVAQPMPGAGWGQPYAQGPYPGSVVPPVPSSQPYPPRPRPSETVHYVVAAAMGLAAAGLIGAAAYLAFGPSDEPSASSATKAAKADTVTAASRDVVLDATPVDAEILVDGKLLTPGRAVVPRPPVGSVLAVTMRARGHRDRTVLVDFFSPQRVAVVLEKAPEPVTETPPATSASSAPVVPAREPAPAVVPAREPPPTSAAAARPEPAPVAPRAEPGPRIDPAPRPARPKTDPALPANPY